MVPVILKDVRLGAQIFMCIAKLGWYITIYLLEMMENRLKKILPDCNAKRFSIINLALNKWIHRVYPKTNKSFVFPKLVLI